MKKSLGLLMIGVSTLLLFSCATGGSYSQDIENNVPLAPEEGKALVYFIRPSSLGWMIDAAVYDWDQMIGMAPAGKALPYQAEPGEHTFVVVSESADFASAELAAGETYFVEVSPRMGVWRARFSLDPISDEELKTEQVQEWIAEAEPIEVLPSAFEWHENNYKSVDEKRTEYYEVWQNKENKPHLEEDDHL